MLVLLKVNFEVAKAAVHPEKPIAYFWLKIVLNVAIWKLLIRLLLCCYDAMLKAWAEQLQTLKNSNSLRIVQRSVETGFGEAERSYLRLVICVVDGDVVERVQVVRESRVHCDVGDCQNP